MTTAQNLQFRARLQLRYLETAGEGARPARPTRSAANRAAYAARPADYIEEVLGGTVAPIVEGVRYDALLRALELIADEPFVLIPGGNGQGKDWLLGALAVWHHDAVGAQPGEFEREAGSRTLLLGPSETSVFQTTYASMLAHATRAEARGFAMPPGRSDARPYWRGHEEWVTEGITPAPTTGQGMAHRASGRHHVNLLAVLGEASDLRSEVIASIIGSASGGGPGRLPDGRWQRNGIVAIFNPDSKDTAVARLMRSSTWRVLHLSALDHVNVRTRRQIIPGACSVAFVDGQVAECLNLGRFPDVQPDQNENQFVYALPDSPGVEGGGPRPDGIPGHIYAEPCVWRPHHLVETRVLGVYPHQDEAHLFKAAAWDAAVARWRRHDDPKRDPDGVGIDCAREGSDDSAGAPRWGPDGFALLARYTEAAASKNAAAVEALRGATRIGRIRCGSPAIPKGDGPDVAAALYRLWGKSPWNVDDGGVGASVLDHARRVLRVAVTPISYGGAAPPKLEGMLYQGETIRDAMHILAATVINLGMVDLPDDPLLREEAMAIWTVDRGKKFFETREKNQFGQVVPVRREVSMRGLPSKRDELRRVLGRSPDRLDSLVEALWRGTQPNRGGAIPLPEIFY